MEITTNTDTAPKAERNIERFGACEVHEFVGSVTAYGLPFIARTPADLRKQAALLETAASYMEKQQADAADERARRNAAKKQGRR